MANSEEKKSGWGGARPGAGAPRKPKTTPGARFGFYLSHAETELLLAAAERDGVTPYEWCKGKVLSALKNTD